MISDPVVALRCVDKRICSCAQRGAVAGCGADIVTVRSANECLGSGAGYLLQCRGQMTRRAWSGTVACFKSTIRLVDSCFFFIGQESLGRSDREFRQVIVAWAMMVEMLYGIPKVIGEIVEAGAVVKYRY